MCEGGLRGHAGTPTRRQSWPEAGRTQAGVAVLLRPRSGRSRRAEGFLAQVLQRRRNHDTFRPYRIDVETRADLARKFLVDAVPSLVVVEDKRVQARLEQPRGCNDLACFLDPWLS